MKCDGVLFDLDGTLWDSTEAVTRSWRRVLKAQPDVLRLPTHSDIVGVMGMTADTLTNSLMPYLSLERRLEIFDLCAADENEELRKSGGIIYEGLEDTLKILKKRVKLAIISNCNREYIDCFFDAHKLDKYFDDWESIGRNGHEKWENILIVSERNNISSPVYVGDTHWDKEAAERAGVPFIHAAYGFGVVKGVAEINTPKELLDILEF